MGLIIKRQKNLRFALHPCIFLKFIFYPTVVIARKAEWPDAAISHIDERLLPPYQVRVAMTVKFKIP